MHRCIKFALLLFLIAIFASAAHAATRKIPAMGEYFKTTQGIMVRVLIRYDGPATSPYFAGDAQGIRQKEAQQSVLRSTVLGLGGKVTNEFRHMNVIAATIPIKQLAKLAATKGVVEITKDRIWEPNFDPATATDKERKDWVKERVNEVTQRVRARAGKMNQIASAIPYRLEYLEQNLVRETKAGSPIQVGGGTIRPVGAGEIKPLLTARGVDPANYAFYNIDTTHAAAIWDATQRGEGIIVGLIDSGTYSAHPLLSGTVIGSEVAPGLAEIEAAFDLDGDGNPDGITPNAESILNNPHGTGTACMIAGHGAVTFSANSRQLQAIEAHAPATVVDNHDGTKDVLLIGSAPSASIYAIKVFPWFGAGSPSSIILAAMDRMITLKDNFNKGKPGGINIQVVNMSLGGPDLFPGFDLEDRVADEMVDVGIQPVISSGNAGPAPYTVSSPGGSLKAITVGAAAEPRHNRIAFEFSFPQLPVGGGASMVPSNRTQIVDFSSRGPLASGYLKPDVVAEGANVMTAWLFDTDGDGLNDTADVAIVGGTSFSSPTTAGGVALLTKFAENNGLSLSGQPIKAALMRTARPLKGMQYHQQGMGFVDFQAAADFWKSNPHIIAGKLNKQKGKFYGQPYNFIDFGSISYAFGTTALLDPGEQSDFILPMETTATDAPYYTYLRITGNNKQRTQPFPAVVRSDFDPDPTDGVPANAALIQNTEVYYADGINTGFNDGDYIFNSLNQVDTSVFLAPNQPQGALGWFTELFPSLTEDVDHGYIPDAFNAPITGAPSAYALTNSHQQMGSNGYADFDRLTFLGDVTNEPINPVSASIFWVSVKRSAVPTSLGTPSMTGTIAENQVTEFSLNLPAPISFYSFVNSFNWGWNNYKFAPPWSGETPYKTKRKVADIDVLVESPSGVLLNTAGLPGAFQGASLNDVETIHNITGPSEAGVYKFTVIGFSIKGVPTNHAKWETRVWDNLTPIIP